METERVPADLLELSLKKIRQYKTNLVLLIIQYTS